LVVTQNYLYVIPAALVLLAGLAAVNRQYRKFNHNIIFLLDALNNGDYSFHFSENKLSVREKELNMVMNRIKEILANAREEVMENEKFLSIVVETVPVGLMIMDEHGGITTVNRTALQWFGMGSLTHVNQLGRVNETYPDMFVKLRPGDSQQLTIANEREELQISMRVNEISFRHGVMRLMTLNNIGNELESKEIESWIRLIRVMTHEIMNSIAPITSLSDTLLGVLRMDTADSENLRKTSMEAFETINTTAKGLSTFVESYRQFTAIPQPVVKSFSARELIEQVIHLHAQLAAGKNIRVQLVPQGDIILYADKNLIVQVLVNILKNAIEAANENSGIQINFTRQNSGKTVIDIANTGNPIPQDILPYIFIPFFTTKEGGSGIGLSVSRYIMRLHGGNLLHSVSAEGMTVFSMVFG
jgi:nitrogen fixation/metabolism regulation signal transduction histidine kinase